MRCLKQCLGVEYNSVNVKESWHLYSNHNRAYVDCFHNCILDSLYLHSGPSSLVFYTWLIHTHTIKDKLNAPKGVLGNCLHNFLIVSQKNSYLLLVCFCFQLPVCVTVPGEAELRTLRAGSFSQFKYL